MFSGPWRGRHSWRDFEVIVYSGTNLIFRIWPDSVLPISPTIQCSESSNSASWCLLEYFRNDRYPIIVFHCDYSLLGAFTTFLFIPLYIWCSLTLSSRMSKASSNLLNWLPLVYVNSGSVVDKVKYLIPGGSTGGG